MAYYDESISTPEKRRIKLEEAFEHFNRVNHAELFNLVAMECLASGHIEELFLFLQSPRNSNLLNFVAWDLAKTVFQFMPYCDDTTAAIKLLRLLCNSGNAREICLSLNELFSTKHLSGPKFRLLLDLLGQTWGRLTGKTSRILSGVLESIQQCLRSEDYREATDDYREATEESVRILESTLDFVSVVLKEWEKRSVSDARGQGEDGSRLRASLVSFLVNFLEFPTASLEFHVGSEEMPAALGKNHELATVLVQHLSTLEGGGLKRLFELGNGDGEGEWGAEVTEEESDDLNGGKLSQLGLGCLAFLTHVIGIGSSCVPQVTTGKYVLRTCAAYMSALISNGGSEVISKGLSLITSVCALIEEDSLCHSYLDGRHLVHVMRNLKNVMLHCEDQVIRRGGLKVFRMIVAVFTPRGKYRLLRTLYQGEIQSGFAELLNLILKEEIAKSLNSRQESWFLGRSLSTFLREDVFKLPSKFTDSEFGIVQESNRILSTLNLLRYLLIRDQENRTEIRSNLPNVEASYLKKLRDVARLSRARINALIRENEEGTRKGFLTPRKQADETTLNVTTVDGNELSRGSPEEELESMKSACLTLDMIESVLARIGEVS